MGRRAVFISVVSCAVWVFAFCFPAFAESGTAIKADDALKMLVEGNQSFVKGQVDHLKKKSGTDSRTEVAKGQHPYAIILACSDSRVPPEILFDKGLGEIFVIRVAGNVVAPHELGGVEYAAEHLGSTLVMVLGHERCGAVTAAVDATGPVEGNIGSIVNDIRPAVEKARARAGTKTREELVEASVDENIKIISGSIESRSHVIHELVKEGKLKIVGAKYDLDTGVVKIMDLH